MLGIVSYEQGRLRCGGRTDKLCVGRDIVGDTTNADCPGSESNSVHASTDPTANLLTSSSSPSSSTRPYDKRHLMFRSS